MKTINNQRPPAKTLLAMNVAAVPRGVLEVYMTEGSDVFFWVENLQAQYFFGVK